ncbi:homeobox protein HMX3 [Nematostella vectensis]|nr:homeobox protein HMX3 [Nematostella vectensis]
MEAAHDKSVIKNYGSAFTPVKPTHSLNNASVFKHPFSIRSLLELDERDVAESSPFRSFSPEHGSTYSARSPDCEEHCEEAYTSPEVVPYSSWLCIPGRSTSTRENKRNADTKQERKHPKKQKQRPLFGQKQIQRLEEEFVCEKYISKSRRSALAAEIDLTDAQVRTWFQNRRTRWRKEERAESRCEKTSWEACESEKPRETGFTGNCLVVRGYCLS